MSASNSLTFSSVKCLIVSEFLFCIAKIIPYLFNFSAFSKSAIYSYKYLFSCERYYILECYLLVTNSLTSVPRIINLNTHFLSKYSLNSSQSHKFRTINVAHSLICYKLNEFV